MKGYLKMNHYQQTVISLVLITTLTPPIFNAAHAALPLAIATTQTIPASFADLVEKIRPAVVSIATRKTQSNTLREEYHRYPFSKELPFDKFFRHETPFDEFFRRFFERQSFQMNRGGSGIEMKGLGSGFIINAEGLIVTNHHVVKESDEITVTLGDGSEHPATVIGYDAKTDLALLKIKVDNSLPYISFGDSDKARVGDWVIAVGNPFGFGDTFTAGIISARGRDIQSGPYDDFIQIDAPINQGNSGGPLVNVSGEVIGINTAIYSPNGGNIGIGFAVPAAIAQPVIDELRENGHVERGWLGVQIQSVTEDIANSLGMANAQGALVAEVLPETPAKTAGILPGDVIMNVNDKPVEDAKALSRMIADTEAGKAVQLDIWRQGSKKSLSVVIGQMSDDKQPVLSQAGEHSHEQLGLTLAEITAQARRQYQLSDEVNGVVIVDIKPASPADETGLKPGDVIIMVNQEPVSSPKEVVDQITQALQAQRQSILLLINRQGTQQFITLNLKMK